MRFRSVGVHLLRRLGAPPFPAIGHDERTTPGRWPGVVLSRDRSGYAPFDVGEAFGLVGLVPFGAWPFQS